MPVSPRLRRAVAATAFGVLVAVPLTAAFASPASAAVGECPTGSYPTLSNGSLLFTDDSPTTFAAGDFDAVGDSAEAEGVTVALGDSSIDTTNNNFNIGSIGYGSQIAPTSGSVMFAVGGDLTVAAGRQLVVGYNEPAGGVVRVGGTATGAIDTQGGRVDQNLGTAATARYLSYGAAILTLSGDLADLDDTGTAAINGTTLTITGDGSTDLQTVTVAGADLAAVTEVDYVGIARTTPIAINVTGAVPVSFGPTSVFNDGVRVDQPGPSAQPTADTPFGDIAARTLFNYEDATSVQIGNGGATNQVLGSVLAPVATSVTLTDSQNGRVYSGGDVVLNGTLNEIHSYPWIGAAETQCTQYGGIGVIKTDTAAPATTLAGAVYDVVDTNGIVVANIGPTAADGTAAVGDLLPGDYTLVETTAPAGYTLDATPVPVTVTPGAPVIVSLSDAKVPSTTPGGGTGDTGGSVGGVGDTSGTGAAELAETGSDTAPFLGGAAALLAVGGLLLALSRRRMRRTA